MSLTRESVYDGEKKMKILITGAKGFVGRNLAETLRNVRDGKDKSRGKFDEINIYEYDVDTRRSFWKSSAQECDFQCSTLPA